MIAYTGLSDIGHNRPRNEDFFVLPPEDDHLCNQLGYLFILCDGLGGYPGGDIAGRVVAQCLERNWYFQLKFPDDPFEAISRFISMASLELNEEKKKHPHLQAMSTTLTLALVHNGRVWMANVGDSRLYCYRRGRLQQLSEDHSFVWELYKNGSITKDEINTHPQNNLLTSAIGIGREYDLFFADLSFARGHLLLCSDGLSDPLKDSEIEHIFRTHRGLKNKAVALMSTALAKKGNDNITFILIRLY